MKQNIPATTAVGIAVVAVLVIGGLMWKLFLSGPPVDHKPTGVSAAGIQRPANFNQMSVQDKKKLYGMGARQ